MLRPKLRRPTLCSGVIAEHRLRQRAEELADLDVPLGERPIHAAIAFVRRYVETPLRWAM